MREKAHEYEDVWNESTWKKLQYLNFAKYWKRLICQIAVVDIFLKRWKLCFALKFEKGAFLSTKSDNIYVREI
jgi:hypothetical protein